jgi:hypothetical protein
MSDRRPNVTRASPTNKARQGVTGHNVRYVLAFGLAGVVIAFALVWFFFFG